MNKFNRIALDRVNRLRLIDLLMDIGTSDKENSLYPGFHHIKVSKRFPKNATSVKQILTKFSEDIYFYCIPETNAGQIVARKMERSGQLGFRNFCTKNIVNALLHNRALKRPLLGKPVKVVVIMDRKVTPFSNPRIRYDFRTSRPVVMAVLDMSLHRRKSEAMQINRRK